MQILQLTSAGMSRSRPDRFLTVAEVAADLRISPDTVRRWIAAGKLPAVRVSARDLRIERAEYDQLLAELRTSAPLVVKA